MGRPAAKAVNPTCEPNCEIEPKGQIGFRPGGHRPTPSSQQPNPNWEIELRRQIGLRSGGHRPKPPIQHASPTAKRSWNAKLGSSREAPCYRPLRKTKNHRAGVTNWAAAARPTLQENGETGSDDDFNSRVPSRRRRPLHNNRACRKSRQSRQLHQIIANHLRRNRPSYHQNWNIQTPK